MMIREMEHQHFKRTLNKSLVCVIVYLTTFTLSHCIPTNIFYRMVKKNLGGEYSVVF